MHDKKILIISPNWIGDAVMATPMVSLLRKAFAQAHIAVLTKPYVEDVWKTQPAVNEIIPFELPASVFHDDYRAMVGHLKVKEFDSAIILSHYARHAALAFAVRIPVRIGYAVRHRSIFLTHPIVYSPNLRNKHMVENYCDFLRPLGVEPALEPLIMYLENSAVQSSAAILAEKGVSFEDTLIGIAPGARFGPAKRWPVRYYAQLLKRIEENHTGRVLIFTGPYDAQVCAELKTYASDRVLFFDNLQSLAAISALLARCKVLVSNDSGLIHIAAAVGVRTVGIYGSTSPVWTGPYGSGHRVLTAGKSCSPCFHEECQYGSYLCLHSISVSQVFAALKEQLAAQGGKAESSCFCGCCNL